MSDSLRPHESQHAGLPVHHHLPEFTQTHVHRVSDAIQPSHPLSSPSPLAPNPSQHQSLFQWVNSLHKEKQQCKPQKQTQIWQRYWNYWTGNLKQLWLRCLLLGRKVMTNLDSIFKSRDIIWPTKIRLVEAMVFPVVMYECESWTVKKAKHRRIDTFQ